MAHMLALDMEVGYADEYSGRRVHVRSAHGDDLFSVPIRQPDQIARLTLFWCIFRRTGVHNAAGSVLQHAG